MKVIYIAEDGKQFNNEEDCKTYENTPENHIIVGMTVLYGNPAVLFKHDGGYAWKYKGEIKNLGNISREKAIEKFEFNFGNKCI